MKLRPKNWDSFQHYKNRRPPWIKLHHTLVDDVNFHSLKGEDAKYLVMIWLIASEDFGYLPSNTELAFRLRIPVKQLEQMLARLQAWIVYDASKPLATQEQDATPEGETEVDEERKEEGEAQPPPPPPPDFTRDHETEIPEGLAIVQYAGFVCEKAHIPASYGLKVKVGDAIKMLAQLESCSEAHATALMVPRVAEAQKQGEKINFWLDDGGWKTKTEVPHGSNQNVTRQRVDKGIGAVAEYLAKRGIGAVGDSGRADGAAVPVAGTGAVAGGIPVGLRTVGGEVLTGPGGEGIGGAAHSPRAEILPKA